MVAPRHSTAWFFRVLFLCFHVFRYTSAIGSQFPKVLTTVMLETVDSALYSGSAVGSPVWVCISTFCDGHTATHFSRSVCPRCQHIFETQDQGTLRNFCLCVTKFCLKLWKHACTPVCVHSSNAHCDDLGVSTEQFLFPVTGAHTSPNYKSQESDSLSHSYLATFSLEFKRDVSMLSGLHHSAKPSFPFSETRKKKQKWIFTPRSSLNWFHLKLRLEKIFQKRSRTRKQLKWYTEKPH